MAYLINDQCTACSVCVPLCPNGAIEEAYGRFRINSYYCTECVGYAGSPQCAENCPVEAIESEEAA